MSSWGLTAPERPVGRASQIERDEPPVRRVREEVRDSVAFIDGRRGGVRPGALAVVSPLVNPVDGMAVAVAE